jgi:hypothetical protein
VVGAAYQVALVVLVGVVDEPKEEEAWVVAEGLEVAQGVL